MFSSKMIPNCLKKHQTVPVQCISESDGLVLGLGVWTQLCNIESHVPRHMHCVSKFTFNINTAPHAYM